MIDNELLKAIQIIAMDGIDRDTSDQWYKHLCRWYSRQFHTPLPQVLDLSHEEVVRTYFEDTLYGIKHGDSDKANEIWAELKLDVTTTEDQREQARLEDDAWADEMLAKIKAEEVKKKAKDVTQEKDLGTLPKGGLTPNLIEEEDSLEMVGEDLSAIPEDPG